MRKQVLSAMLVVTLAATTLTGCGSDPEDEKDDKASVKVSESEQTDIEDEGNTIDKEEIEDTDSKEDFVEMVRNEVIPAYEIYVKKNAMSMSPQPYSFIYLNDDEIPELVVQGDCEASGNIICTYINNQVVVLQTSRLHFSYIPKHNLLNNSGGNMGVYYDKIYSIGDEDFILLNDGEWNEVYDEDYSVKLDENGNILCEYSWDGQEVSSEEYEECLSQVYDIGKEIDSYEMTYYSSIREAYEGISVITYTADCSTVYEFEIVDDHLIVRTDGDEPISIGYPISSKCIWYRCYVGNEDEASETLSFEEIKEHLKGLRQEAKNGSYTCWNGLGIRVQNNEVTKVYIIAQ